MRGLDRIVRHGWLGLACSIAVLSASAPQALTIRFAPIDPSTPLVQGDEITVEMRLDNPDEPNILRIFASVAFDPAVLAFRNGVSPGALFLDLVIHPTLFKAADPFVQDTDPPGLLRAVNFVGSEPSPFIAIRSDQLLARLTFEVLTPTAVQTQLVSFVAPGDGIAVLERTPTGASEIVSIVERVTFEASDPITIAAIPEPSAALLLGLGLAALGRERRRAVLR